MDLKKLDLKIDDRGVFVEAWRLPNDGQISYITIYPLETRGNHYHERKTENFLVLSGSAEFQIKDRETGNINKVSVTGLQPMTVKIIPNHTHTVTATDEGCVCLIWCDEQFNDKDADTIKEEL